MKIDFKKVPSLAQDITLSVDNVQFVGTMQKENRNLALLSGTIKGNSELVCDRCGGTYGLLIDEKLSLKIFNGIMPVEIEDDLDIIEVDEVIDFDEILFGEIESIKLDYNYCKNCKEIQGV